jgi:hypothetical protein
MDARANESYTQAPCEFADWEAGEAGRETMMQQNDTATAGSTSATSGTRSWQNLPAQRQEKVAAVVSDRNPKSSHNVPLPPQQNS